MSHTLTISNELYARLEALVRKHNLKSVEDLLDLWQAREGELVNRQEAVRRIDALRERLFTAYGEMPDSVELIRSDRAR